MILLREIQEQDLKELNRFANAPGFINLTGDGDRIKKILEQSVRSFKHDFSNPYDGKYIFVAYDLKLKRVVGTSMIAGQHGTIDRPHFYFQVGSEQKFSQTINTGFIHGTLTLGFDTDGPSEISGLVTDPDYRDKKIRLGRQISFVRFLYLGLNRKHFKKNIHAELLPPVNKRGQSPLWEAIGRRFTNMDYMEADRLCQKNKEFIFALFPEGKVYTTFISAEARNAIGRVNKKTEPVVHMMTKISLEYKDQVDPFDGGPHYGAEIDRLTPIQNLRKFTYSGSSDSKPSQEQPGLLCKIPQVAGQFRAMDCRAFLLNEMLKVDLQNFRVLEKELDLKQGDSVAFMPYYI